MKQLTNIIFKNKPFIIVSSCIIISLFGLQSLQANSLPTRGPIPFYIYDINSNGSITHDEFNTIRGLRMQSRSEQGRPMKNMASDPKFDQFDSDKNGQLSPDELTHGQQLQRQKRQSQRMSMRQGRGNGKGHSMPVFENFDKNQDGLLTPDEFSSGMQSHMQNRKNMMRGQSMGMGMRQMQGQSQGINRGRNQPKFTDFDTDNNGYISEQELIESRSMRISNRIQQGYQMRNTPNITQFKDIDSNADGKISPEEFSTQQKQHQMGNP